MSSIYLLLLLLLFVALVVLVSSGGGSKRERRLFSRFTKDATSLSIFETSEEEKKSPRISNHPPPGLGFKKV